VTCGKAEAPRALCSDDVVIIVCVCSFACLSLVKFVKYLPRGSTRTGSKQGLIMLTLNTLVALLMEVVSANLYYVVYCPFDTTRRVC